MTKTTSRRAVLDRKAYRKAYYKAFGKRLREARVRLGLTEQEAAKAAGRSVATWRLYEETGNGHVTRPALEFFSKYRVALRRAAHRFGLVVRNGGVGRRRIERRLTIAARLTTGRFLRR